MRDASERDYEKRNQRHEKHPAGARGGGGLIGVTYEVGNRSFDVIDNILPSIQHDAVYSPTRSPTRLRHPHAASDQDAISTSPFVWREVELQTFDG